MKTYLIDFIKSALSHDEFNQVRHVAKRLRYFERMSPFFRMISNEL